MEENPNSLCAAVVDLVVVNLGIVATLRGDDACNESFRVATFSRRRFQEGGREVGQCVAVRSVVADRTKDVSATRCREEEYQKTGHERKISDVDGQIQPQTNLPKRCTS